MKTTLNLAVRHNLVWHLSVTIARWLLPLLGCWLIYLLVSQGMVLHRWQNLEKERVALTAKVRSEYPAASRPVSAEAIKRQEDEMAFVNTLAAKDRFSWTELLGRLEKALTQGITLTGIEPNTQVGSLQITGLAENVGTLQKYLTSHLHTESLSDIYLLRQEFRKIKVQGGQEQSVVAFRIEIKKAFR
ncbi:type II secretion system protein PulN, putative [Syntrophotalea carbinolica DSM 2380]|uniref:Type II secretion system protein PulN, putative n=1 Tax=Syntrophotalea carbinolica (strain DSM 2380 / NBRC 103641 / GraBd1) TaxID=338963 RepID=Q3A897_SYNC1|nr:type II secretion system protein PulN [Syntrophotalea carbinolica]ABA87395.1 type II secretion system protein PulN, putative [Syntrophotalea carbinolica DSM 2380]